MHQMPETDLESKSKLNPEEINPMTLEEGDPQNRNQWTNQLDFLFSIIGFAVDLSNVFRFPYVCYRNGGGAFLIPYFIMLLLTALPMFYLELVLGQYMKCGGLTIWKLCPIFKGVGYASILLTFYVALYYNVIIAWSLYYLAMSFSSVLPWTRCDGWWNTPNCYTPFLDSDPLRNSRSIIKKHNSTIQIDPATEFLENNVLKVSESAGIHDLGPLKWDITLTLFILYIIIYLCLFKGVKVLGKAVWVTAILPYIILSVLLIRGVMLEGAVDGILYFITPKFDVLLRPEVWIEAATQIFFSIGVGFSVHIAYASYNNFNQPVHRDCLIAAAVNSITSLFSGFVVFTYLGYMSKLLNKPLAEVVSHSPTLIFIVYPQALATLPVPQFWSVLFFIMLFSLGLDSSFGALEAFITAVLDEYESFFKKLKYRREIMTGVLMAVLFILSLPNTTYGGLFVIHLMDKFSAGMSLVALSLLECVGFVWFFGINNTIKAVWRMNGLNVRIVFRILVKFVTPLLLAGIVISQFFADSKLTASLANRNYTFPDWSVRLGQLLAVSSLLLVPIVAVVVVITTKARNSTERLALVISPVWEHEHIRASKQCARFRELHWTQI